MTIHTESTFFTDAEYTTISEFTDFLYNAIGGVPLTVKDAITNKTLVEVWTRESPTKFKIVRDWVNITEFDLYKAEVAEGLTTLSKLGIHIQPELYVETIS